MVLREGFFCVAVGRRVGRREGKQAGTTWEEAALTLVWAGVVAEKGELEKA